MVQYNNNDRDVRTPGRSEADLSCILILVLVGVMNLHAKPDRIIMQLHGV
jgi:hypothetical protein